MGRIFKSIERIFLKTHVRIHISA